MKPGFTRTPAVKFHVRGTSEQITKLLHYHCEAWRRVKSGGSGPIRDVPGMSASHADVEPEFADAYEAKLVELGLKKLKRHK